MSPLVAALPAEARAAAVALGTYGRLELTPAADVELLVLHDGSLSAAQVTETVWFPLWGSKLHLEPVLRTVDECVSDVRAWQSPMPDALDARFVAGDPNLFDALVQRAIAPLRHDRVALRMRLAPRVQRRHAGHAAVTVAAVPDLVEGRGGLRDTQVLRWLEPKTDPRVLAALDFLLQVSSVVETLAGRGSHRLAARLHERVAATLGFGHGVAGSEALLASLYAHARWVAFHLDGALGPPREDRSFGLSLAVKRGRLVGERLPLLERVPSLGLRVAHLVGLAPPDTELLDWAAQRGPAIDWDAATREQFWLLLRAADWRSWTFLDTSGLLERYVPEWSAIARRRSGTGQHDFALDSHSFLALRRLHEWLDTDDPFAARLWQTLRRRDWVYLAVLLHEIGRDAATAIARRCGLSDEGSSTVAWLVEDYRRLAEIATQRDLHDEDVLFDIAARIGSRPRLRMLFLVAIAHALASGGSAWTTWRMALLRRLFALLDTALRTSNEVGPRRSRSVEHHRERIARDLARRNQADLVPLVSRLPRRYVLAHSAAFIARHLGLTSGRPLEDGEVRLRAERHRRAPEWDVLVVARDRPGLLATMAGVLALRGATVLAADAATTSDGLALNVFTVGSAYGAPLEPALWPLLTADLQAALDDRLPLEALLASAPTQPGQEPGSITVHVDNDASQLFSLIEVRAPDRVGLLYRITRALSELGLDIHHAKVATHLEGALDVFYVWDLSGNKLDQEHACQVSDELTRRLHG